MDFFAVCFVVDQVQLRFCWLAPMALVLLACHNGAGFVGLPQWRWFCWLATMALVLLACHNGAGFVGLPQWRWF